MSGSMTATECTSRRGIALALGAVLAAALSVLAMMPAADADPTYDGEIDLYGYEVVMMLNNPSQVSTVEWDFGDGSEHETVTLDATNPNGMVEHKYAAKGDYVVTATMRNQYTDPTTGEVLDGESKLTYIYHILGFPIVTFDSKGGSPVPTIEGTSSHYVPAKPADPTRDGFDFKGWYEDEGCTRPFDWSSEVTKHTTLYAGWDPVPVTEYTFTLRYDANGGTGAPADDTFTGTSPDAHVFTVASSVPVREGYRFDGWADTADATAPVYKAGDAVSVEHGQTKTIHAVWLKILVVTMDAPSTAVIGTTVMLTFTVNQRLPAYFHWEDVTPGMTSKADVIVHSAYSYSLTFTALKAGTFNITLVVEHPGCVTAKHPVTIEFLPTDVTVPPSAEGIEAEVKE